LPATPLQKAEKQAAIRWTQKNETTFRNPGRWDSLFAGD
jgi:hypothetical protein